MGKEKPGFLTPKAIANRIKAKGLQKLRWYCQMCQKQCRDENGFKCHTTSESHQRQLLLFADNSHKFMDEFSRDFNKEYVNTLRRRFGTKRVHANIVYQEYINDRNHIHMNATRWLTLTDYVQWLGRQGICIVDETEKGWFVTYIDRDPETLRRQEEIEKKKKLDLDDRQRQQMYLEKQMERAKEKEQELPVAAPTELIREEEDEPLKLNFIKLKPLVKSSDMTSTSVKSEDTSGNDLIKSEPMEVKSEKEYEKEKVVIKKEPDTVFKKPASVALNLAPKPKTEPSVKPSTSSSSLSGSSSKPEKRKQSSLNEIIEMEEKKREKMNRKDYWLHKNIVVKIVTSKLGEKFHKKKALVTDVIDEYTAVVKVIESGAVVKLDQAHLETVLPNIGKQVLVVNGAYRGEAAILEQVNQASFDAKITIQTGPFKGRPVNGVQYEDICKLHTE